MVYSIMYTINLTTFIVVGRGVLTYPFKPNQNFDTIKTQNNY